MLSQCYIVNFKISIFYIEVKISCYVVPGEQNPTAITGENILHISVISTGASIPLALIKNIYLNPLKLDLFITRHFFSEFSVINEKMLL